MLREGGNLVGGTAMKSFALIGLLAVVAIGVVWACLALSHETEVITLGVAAVVLILGIGWSCYVMGRLVLEWERREK